MTLIRQLRIYGLGDKNNTGTMNAQQQFLRSQNQSEKHLNASFCGNTDLKGVNRHYAIMEDFTRTTKNPQTGLEKREVFAYLNLI